MDTVTVSIGDMDFVINLDEVTSTLAKAMPEDDAIVRKMLYDLDTFDHQVDHLELYAMSIPAIASYAQTYCKIGPEEKVLFQALFRRALVKSRLHLDPNEHVTEPPVLMAPQASDYDVIKSNVGSSSNLQAGQDLLSKVVVVKFVTCSESSVLEEIVPLIEQIKALNRKFSCNIPLFLVSAFFNNAVVTKAARIYTDIDLTIHPLKQPVFPFADEGPSVAPSKSVRELFGIAPQPTGYNRCIRLSKGRLQILSDHLTSLPYERQLDAWYLPGDGYAVCKLIASNEIAKAKEYVLVWNSSDFENLLDMNILSHLSRLSESGQLIDICLEVAAARECRNLDSSSEYLIQSGQRQRVLDKASLESLQYFGDEADDMVFTKNMWIRMAFLTSGDVAKRLGEVTCLRKMELGGHPAMKLAMSVAYLSELDNVSTLAIKVPPRRMEESGSLSWLWRLMNPTWAMRLRIRLVSTYFVAYLLYHITVYWLMALLHGVFIPEDDRSIDEIKRSCRGSEEGELSLFWAENGIWLLTLGLYTWFLTTRRLKMAGWSRRIQDRETQARVDAFQVALLGATRFLYSGLKKTAEIRGWCQGNVWKYLAPLHACAFFVEFVGSCLILWYHGEFTVLEPMEPS